MQEFLAVEVAPDVDHADIPVVTSALSARLVDRTIAVGLCDSDDHASLHVLRAPDARRLYNWLRDALAEIDKEARE